jgi:hypothetical protein
MEYLLSPVTQTLHEAGGSCENSSRTLPSNVQSKNRPRPVVQGSKSIWLNPRLVSERRPNSPAHVNGKDAVQAQLEAGLACWYRVYADEQVPSQRLAYRMTEGRAAADRKGLRQERNAVPPREFGRLR